eukprot:TRINITY_DN2212_c0_g1_i9.p1 TRINITY_DN2212_c0_g1~~TRINITY_DN2212_c0_g1_i9.p1  ORF type:complete len:1215 (+),score=208.65 TRINITY_DN2212_c0_g1_i9:52-3696(+)
MEVQRECVMKCLFHELSRASPQKTHRRSIAWGVFDQISRSVSGVWEYLVPMIESTTSFSPLQHRSSPPLKGMREYIETLCNPAASPLAITSALQDLAMIIEMEPSKAQDFFLSDGLRALLISGSMALPAAQFGAARISLDLFEYSSVQQMFMSEEGLGLLCMWSSSDDDSVRWIGCFCLIRFASVYLESETMLVIDPYVMLSPIANLLDLNVPLAARRMALSLIAPLTQFAEIRNVLGNQSCAMALIDNCLTGDYFIIQHCTEILENLSFKESFPKLLFNHQNFYHFLNCIVQYEVSAGTSHFTIIISNITFEDDLTFEFVMNGGIQILTNVGQVPNPEYQKFAMSTLSLLSGFHNFQCEDCLRRIRGKMVSMSSPNRDYKLCPDCFANTNDRKTQMEQEESQDCFQEATIDPNAQEIWHKFDDNTLIELLLNFCQSEDKILMFNSINILSNLVLYERIVLGLIEKGLFDIISRLCEHPITFVQQASRWILCSICCQDQCRQAVVKSRAWQILVKMAHSTDIISQIRAARALSYLSCAIQEEEYYLWIADGLLKTITTIAANENQKLQLYCMIALDNLSQFRDEKEASFFVSEGGYQAAITYLFSQTSLIRSISSRILQRLSMYEGDRLIHSGILNALGLHLTADEGCLQSISGLFLNLCKFEGLRHKICHHLPFLKRICLYACCSAPGVRYQVLSSFIALYRIAVFKMDTFSDEYISFLSFSLSAESDVKDPDHEMDRIVRVRMTVKLLLPLTMQSKFHGKITSAGFVGELLRVSSWLDREITSIGLECLRNLTISGGPLSTSSLSRMTSSDIKIDEIPDATIEEFKCIYGDQEITIKTSIENCFRSIMVNLRQHLKEDVSIGYVDDEGDYVSIWNQEDLAEALQYQQLRGKLAAFRLIVQQDQNATGVMSPAPSVITLTLEDDHETPIASPSHSRIADSKDSDANKYAMADELDGVLRQGSGGDNVLLTEASMSQVIRGELIDRGAYSEIYVGVWRNQTIAIKRPLTFDTNQQSSHEILKEVQTLRELRHENIVIFLGASVTSGSLYILTEYLSRGSLYQNLHNKSLSLSWETRMQMALDAARGMRYLHCRDPMIIHCDLKSPNLLVSENWVVKVADFGMSQTKSMVQMESRLIGTCEWMAPEVIRGDSFDEKVDIYSFGIILWELLTRMKPYRNQHPMQVAVDVISKDARPPIPEHADPGYKSLMMYVSKQ